ncbi:hypothetical protein [Deinococcus taeanensis]|nr:hypothetical protein [Deinococcus taeanensis]
MRRISAFYVLLALGSFSAQAHAASALNRGIPTCSIFHCPPH